METHEDTDTKPNKGKEEIPIADQKEKIVGGESKEGSNEISKLSTKLSKIEFTAKSHIWKIPKGRHLMETCFFCRELFGIGSNSTVKKCKMCRARAHDSCVFASTETFGCIRPQEVFILDEELIESRTPLIAFINPLSGPQVGHRVHAKLCDILGLSQVFDLSKEGPERGLKKFKDVKNLRVLAAGGDGTVSWVLDTINRLEFDINPPIGILPLGTGNDLSREFGWGAGYTKEKVMNILMDMKMAPICLLDRWKVDIIKDNKKKHKTMNNYMSIGADAEIAFGFHQKRQENPDMFTSRFVNKLWYVYYGSKAFVKPNLNLGDIIELEVDGVVVDFPPDLTGMIIVNLHNYAGGNDLWGYITNEDMKHFTKRPDKNRCDDGCIEVVGVRGTFDVGAMASGLVKPLKLGQGMSIKINAKKHKEKEVENICLQVDGEPWIEEIPFEVKISILDRANLLSSNTIPSHVLIFE